MTVNHIATVAGCLTGLGVALLGYCIGNYSDWEDEEEASPMGFYPREETTDSESESVLKRLLPRRLAQRSR